MLYDQIIIAPREDISVVCIKAETEYVAGMFAIHHAGLLLSHLSQCLIHMPQQHALIVATWKSNEDTSITLPATGYPAVDSPEAKYSPP